MAPKPLRNEALPEDEDTLTPKAAPVTNVPEPDPAVTPEEEVVAQEEEEQAKAEEPTEEPDAASYSGEEFRMGQEDVADVPDDEFWPSDVERMPRHEPKSEAVRWLAGANPGTSSDIVAEQIINEAVSKDYVKRKEEANRVAFDPDLDPSAKISKIRELDQQGEDPTIGKALIDKAFPDLPDPQENYDGMNVTVLRNENHEIMASILSDGETNDLDSILDAEILLGDTGADRLGVTIGKEEPTTFRDIIDFINLSPVSMDAKSSDEVFGEVFSDLWDRGDITPETEAMLVKRLGKDWGPKILSYAAAQIGIDAAVLIMVALVPPLAVIAFPAKAAKLAGVAMSMGTKVAAVLTRAAAVGIGGGTIHTGMNVYTEQVGSDPKAILKDFAYEAGTSAVGEIGGELIIKGAKVVLKPIISKTKSVATKAAAKAGIKTRDPLTVNGLLTDSGVAKSSAAAEVIKATLKRHSDQYQRLSTVVSRSIVGPLTPGADDAAKVEMDAILKEAAFLTGVKEEDMVMMPALDVMLRGGKPIKDWLDLSTLPSVDNMLNRETLDATVTKTQKEINTLNKLKDRLQKQTFETADASVLKAKEKLALNPADKNNISALARAEKHRAEKLAKWQEVDRAIQAKNSVLSGQSFAKTTTGYSMADKILLGEAMGPRAMGEVINQQRLAGDVFHMYLAPHEANYGTNTGGVGTRAFKWWSMNPARFTLALKRLTHFDEPTNYPMWETAKDLFRQSKTGDKILQGFARTSRKIFNSLGTKDKMVLHDLLQKGSDEEELFSLARLAGMKDVTPEIQDAYYAMRQLMDQAHFILNDSMVKKAHRSAEKGFVRGSTGMHKNKNYDIISDPDKFGMVTAREISDTASEVAKEIKIPQGSIEQVVGMLPSHTGYLPHVYANAKFHVSILDVKEGTVKRVGAANTLAKGRDLFAKLRKANNLGEGQVMVMNEWDELTGYGRVSYGNTAGFKWMDVATEESLTKLKMALSEDTSIGLDNIRVSLDMLDMTSMKKRFIGARSKVPLKTVDNQGNLVNADLRDPIDVLPEYFQSVAYSQGVGDWTNVAVREWRRMYAPVLKNANASVWDKDAFLIPDRMISAGDKESLALQKSIKELTDKLSKANKAADSASVTKITKELDAKNKIFDARMEAQQAKQPTQIRAMYNDARRMQKWIRTASSGMTDHERFLDSMIRNWTAKNLSSASTVARGVATVVDKYVPNAAKAFGMGRFGAAHAKLLFFALPQLYVQGLQSVATIGAHPIHGIRGVKRSIEVAYAAALEGKSMGFATKKTRQALYAIRKSGFSADLSASDIGAAPYRPAGGAAGIFKRGLVAVGEAGKIPFKGGEAFNRSVAFFTIREMFTDLHAQGKLLVKGRPFTGMIDDDEFLDLVMQKAKTTSFSMGRAGQLEHLGGAMSVVFQFKQVGFKFLNMFEEAPDLVTGMTFGEKFRSGAAMFGLLGAPALPFLPDLMWTMDQMGAMVNSRPTKQEFWSDMSRATMHDVIGWIGETPLAELEKYGMTPKFYERLLTKGAINALTEGEVELTHRIALGRFFGDTIDNTQDVASLIPFVDATRDLYNAAEKLGVTSLVNIALWSEVMYLAFTNDEPVDYTLEKVLKEADDLSPMIFTNPKELGIVSAKNMGEIGKLYPVVAGLDRMFRNADTDSWGMPAYTNKDRDSGFRERTFATASKPEGVPGVGITTSRVIQSAIGLTPGALVEEYDATRKSKKIKKAWGDWKQRRLQDYLDAPNKESRMRIMEDVFREASAIGPYLDEIDSTEPWSPHTEHQNAVKMFYEADRNNIESRNTR